MQIIRLSVTGCSSTYGYSSRSGTHFFPDTARNPFNIGIGCVINSTGVTYNVEHTWDYTGSSVFTSSAATWFIHSTIAAASSNVNSNYAYPVSAIRLNVLTGSSSTGTVTASFIQAGEA